MTREEIRALRLSLKDEAGKGRGEEVMGFREVRAKAYRDWKREIRKAVDALSIEEAEEIFSDPHCSVFRIHQFFGKHDLHGKGLTYFHRYCRYRICDKLGMKRPGQRKGAKWPR